MCSYSFWLVVFDVRLLPDSMELSWQLYFGLVCLLMDFICLLKYTLSVVGRNSLLSCSVIRYLVVYLD